ncbi:ankyrin repeat-containing domain protein [Corynascus similis CBS 632.67]
MSMSDTVPSAALLAAIDGFLASGRKLDAWLSIEWLPRATKGVTSSHVAARFGLTHYLESLVQCTRLSDVNSRDCKDQTMLFHAAEGGHAGVVKLLIDVGADPDAENHVGLKPLHRAATNGHAAVVAVLLHAGVDPLTKKTRDGPHPGYGKMPSTIGQTPLMYACQAGHVAAVEAFLPYLKCIETVQWALHWASNAGQAKVVQRLLQHPGVDVNAKLRGCTPLFRACAGNDLATIEVLLEAGADATVLCQEHPNEQPSRDTHKPGPDCSLSPLEAFCNFRPEDTRPELDISQLQRGLALLLQAGADIHRRDFLLRTPLHHASQRPPLFYLLLRAGVDANAVTRDGTIPFHTLNMKGKWGLECINLLAEQGKVDINKRNPNDPGRTLLMRLIRCIPLLDPSVCLAFINSLHPDCTIADEYGNAALHLAARIKPLSIRLRILEALLAAGARVDQRNRRGEMPIHVAHEISTIELLVSRGADLEAQNSTGATPLMRCVRDENLSFHTLMADLLRIGARLDTRDFEGRTVIHNAIGNLSCQGPRAKDEVEVLQHILNFGIDPRQVDYAGNTVLHQLLQRKSLISRGTDLRGLVFERLVTLGVDPKAANHCGQTVLHVLSTKPYDAPMIDIVISACKEIINLPDNEVRRPIHLAVTVSEGTVAKLINAGANVSVSTDKRETPLHLAAAAEESNIVGMLLTTIQTTLQERAAALRLINAAGTQGRTPLYHACLSGIPESVALLLGAGAETKREFCGPFENCLSCRLLEACTLFEREGRRKVEEVTGVSQPWMFFDPQYKFIPIPRNFYTRLDEILPMLADHGLDCCCVKKSLRVSLDSAIDKLSGSDFDHTLKCFRRLKAKTVGGNERTTLSEFEPGLAFTRRWAEIRCDAATRAFHEMNLNFLVEGDRELSEKLFLKLLGSREFYLFETTCKTAERHLLLLNERGWTVLHVLVALGHASLLERIATPAQVRLIDDPEWRKAQERTLGDGVKQPDFSICPLVLTAFRRDSPNMGVLRLLVERLNASVNASCLGHDWLEPARYVLDDSPLHQVARGERWWQAYKALPYLLSQKPNLNVRNRVGETPLHIAIQKPPYFSNPFRKHVAKLLIEGGADVNAVTNSGVSCLEAAGDDTELVRLLIDHGAQVSVREVFAAIDTKNVQGCRRCCFLTARLNSEDDPF